MNYEDVVVSPLRGHRYIVKRPLRFKDVTVPRGYVTNGADIPRMLWSFVPPNRSDILPAVVVHDFLCDCEEFEKADKYFREILELLGVDAFTVVGLHTGVRIYSLMFRPLLGLLKIKK